MPSAPRVKKYNGLTVFLPNIAVLLPGDILLTLNAESEGRKGLKHARVITRATRGRFSHALICSAPPTFVEAIDAGVSTLSLGRCFAHSLENVRVLRYPDAEVSARAANLAQLEVGRDYSKTKAIASVFPERIITKIVDQGIFCSALVAQVFTVAGAAEFSAIPIEKTTPATIDEMSGLQDISSIAFRAALAPGNIETLSALDGDRVPSPSFRQTEINNRYARELKPAAQHIAIAYPEAGLRQPISFFETIRFIMEAVDSIPAMRSQGRSGFEVDVAALDFQAAQLFDTGELAGLLHEILELDDAQLQRSLMESFRAEPDIDVNAMRHYLATSITQLDSRTTALQSFIEWGPERSRAVAGYIAIESLTLAPIERRVDLLKEILARVD
jgi:hypothetical protein